MHLHKYQSCQQWSANTIVYGLLPPLVKVEDEGQGSAHKTMVGGGHHQVGRQSKQHVDIGHVAIVGLSLLLLFLLGANKRLV